MRILIIGIIFGVYLLYSYDYLRIFRRIIKHFDFIVVLEDLFYCLHAGIILFLILQNECEGKLRYYVILMTFLGMLLYHFALGRVAVPAVVWFLEVIGNVISKGKRRLTRQIQKVKITIRKYLCKLHGNSEKENQRERSEKENHRENSGKRVNSHFIEKSGTVNRNRKIIERTIRQKKKNPGTETPVNNKGENYQEAEEWHRKEIREKESGEKFLLSERKKKIY